MKSVVALLVLGLTAVLALPSNPERILGGQLATIGQYPSAVAMLRGSGNLYSQSCGGIIITNNVVMTAAHCVYRDAPLNWRARVGSSWANSGGIVVQANRILINNLYNDFLRDNDAALIYLANSLIFNNNVNRINLAGPNYILSDNQTVWSIGWGRVSVNGAPSEQLRQVQTWVVNPNICANRYRAFNPNYQITANMICAGNLDAGGRDFCQGDAGGPLIHNNVAVGILSWGEGCSRADLPGVSTRISRIANWIGANV